MEKAINFETVAPTPLLSTNSLVALAEIDVRHWKSLAYTIAVATNSIDWTVFGANASDYSDEQVVQVEAAVGAAATGTYAVTQAPYSYYRVKIKSTTPDSHGTATVRGIAKAG